MLDVRCDNVEFFRFLLYLKKKLKYIISIYVKSFYKVVFKEKFVFNWSFEF